MRRLSGAGVVGGIKFDWKPTAVLLYCICISVCSAEYRTQEAIRLRLVAAVLCSGRSIPYGADGSRCTVSNFPLREVLYGEDGFNRSAILLQHS
jgi:hypothetical protein